MPVMNDPGAGEGVGASNGDRDLCWALRPPPATLGLAPLPHHATAPGPALLHPPLSLPFWVVPHSPASLGPTLLQHPPLPPAAPCPEGRGTPLRPGGVQPQHGKRLPTAWCREGGAWMLGAAWEAGTRDVLQPAADPTLSERDSAARHHAMPPALSPRAQLAPWPQLAVAPHRGVGAEGGTTGCHARSGCGGCALPWGHALQPQAAPTCPHANYLRAPWPQLVGTPCTEGVACGHTGGGRSAAWGVTAVCSLLLQPVGRLAAYPMPYHPSHSTWGGIACSHRVPRREPGQGDTPYPVAMDCSQQALPYQLPHTTLQLRTMPSHIQCIPWPQLAAAPCTGGWGAGAGCHVESRCGGHAPPHSHMLQPAGVACTAPASSPCHPTPACHMVEANGQSPCGAQLQGGHGAHGE